MKSLTVVKEDPHYITRYIRRRFGTWLLHWHPEIEIAHVLEGPCVFVVGNTSYDANVGDFLITSPCVPHQFIMNPKREVEIVKFTARLFSSPLPLSVKPFIKKEEIEAVPGLTERLLGAFAGIAAFEEAGNQALSDSYTETLYLLLSHYFGCEEAPPGADDRQMQKLTAIISEIDLHYMRPLTLESLAAAINYSPGYVSQLFMKNIGMTCKDYIDRTRISHAMRKFDTNPTCSVTDVAIACGYDNLHTFSNVFRRILGVTPSEYRSGLAPTKIDRYFSTDNELS